MILKIITVNDHRFAVINTHGEPIPGNTGGRDSEYFIILSDDGRTWYEFKQQPLHEQFDLRYLEEKLGMDAETAKEFIPQFNLLVD